MLNRRTFLATVALGALGVPQILRSAGRQESMPDGAATIVCAIGDLERATEAGRMLAAHTSSESEQQKIIADVVRENPSLILLLGDQVSEGANMREWNYFDSLTRPFRDANIPTLAVRGEHDHAAIHTKIADTEFATRWPAAMNSRPQVHTIGSIAFLGLDSTFYMMSKSEISEQQTIFVETLAKYDSDPAIRGVVVFVHHPPYSNSPLGPNKDVISQFAEPFIAATKTRLFLCGHVHSYERFSFKDGEKQFVTSGGGGAPRRSVDVSEGRRFKNDHAGPLGSVRPFNYVKMSITDEAIRTEVMMLQKKGFIVGDRFTVKLP